MVVSGAAGQPLFCAPRFSRMGGGRHALAYRPPPVTANAVLQEATRRFAPERGGGARFHSRAGGRGGAWRGSHDRRGMIRWAWQAIAKAANGCRSPISPQTVSALLARTWTGNSASISAWARATICARSARHGGAFAPASTNLTIAEISQHCGYQPSKIRSRRVFRKQLGQTP